MLDLNNVSMFFAAMDFGMGGNSKEQNRKRKQKFDQLSRMLPNKKPKSEQCRTGGRYSAPATATADELFCYGCGSALPSNNVLSRCNKRDRGRIKPKNIASLLTFLKSPPTGVKSQKPGLACRACYDLAKNNSDDHRRKWKQRPEGLGSNLMDDNDARYFYGQLPIHETESIGADTERRLRDLEINKCVDAKNERSFMALLQLIEKVLCVCVCVGVCLYLCMKVWEF